MKAIVVRQYGGPEVLKFEDCPDPAAGPGEVLVRVAAASVNPIDYKRRAGFTRDFYPLKFPSLIGVDMAGTVVKTGTGAQDFSAEDQVFAMADNTYAELCVVKAAVLAKIPKRPRSRPGRGAAAGGHNRQATYCGYGNPIGPDGHRARSPRKRRTFGGIYRQATRSGRDRRGPEKADGGSEDRRLPIKWPQPMTRPRSRTFLRSMSRGCRRRKNRREGRTAEKLIAKVKWIGISTPEQARDMVRLGADGVITGSRVIQIARKNVEEVGPYVQSMCAAIEPART